jgi:hypothetical protein
MTMHEVLVGRRIKMNKLLHRRGQEFSMSSRQFGLRLYRFRLSLMFAA